MRLDVNFPIVIHIGQIQFIIYELRVTNEEEIMSNPLMFLIAYFHSLFPPLMLFSFCGCPNDKENREPGDYDATRLSHR